MDLGRFLVETHLRTGKPISELAKAHGVSRSWLYKRLARYRAEGEAGLELRSRRPRSSPARTPLGVEVGIVAMRKSLSEAGFDAGAATIHYHLSRQRTAPSVSTIWRVLRARGFVTPQPHKRPKSSWVRFVAELPNQCWQADVTHVVMADGSFCEVLNIIDDHSRLCVESRAFIIAKSPDVVRALHRAAGKWGYPESFLTDNGAIFTASMRGNDAGAMEAELLSLGIASKHSRPYHPQTCGKVERFHQTLKRFLAKQDPPTSKKALQTQLDHFVEYYNHIRPHRGIGRRPPIEAFRAREKATPAHKGINTVGYRIRHDKVSSGGNVTLRHKGRLHHIGVGHAFDGWRVVLLVAGLEVRILDLEGNQIRRLRLDPTKDYQPQL